MNRESLEQEKAKIERVKARIGVLTLWYSLPSEDLLRILEAAEYAYPMFRDNDSRIIADHLWHVHRNDLTQELQQRLCSLVGSAKLSDAASRNIEVYLLALKGDDDKLFHFWKSKHSFLLMECFSQTNTRNQIVIDDLIDIVEKPGFLLSRGAKR